MGYSDYSYPISPISKIWGGGNPNVANIYIAPDCNRATGLLEQNSNVRLMLDEKSAKPIDKHITNVL